MSAQPLDRVVTGESIMVPLAVILSFAGMVLLLAHSDTQTKDKDAILLTAAGVFTFVVLWFWPK